ncbi:MAG: hypothetical protein M0C28_31730 [Candidatus Moduliflexus flocculans]|nr:hypothetical protein [Candidatus Moduliflexus flocculans]
MNAIQAIGYEGEIYPVNPKGGEFGGKKIFTSLQEIPGLGGFRHHRRSCRACARRPWTACRLKGIAGAEILSAGFSESGTREGRALEEQIRSIAAKGIRVVGPNCFGIYCPASGLTLLPGPDLSREQRTCGLSLPERGHVHRLRPHRQVDRGEILQGHQLRQRRRPAGDGAPRVPRQRPRDQGHRHVHGGCFGWQEFLPGPQEGGSRSSP